MKKHFSLLAAAFLMLLCCACGNSSNEPEKISPVVELTIDSGNLRHTSVVFTIKALNAKFVYIYVTKDAAEPTAAIIRNRGNKTINNTYTVKDLERGVQYYAYALPVSEDDKDGKIQKLTFTTLDSNLYFWEEGRYQLPEIADMMLCYGGSQHRNSDTAPWDGMWPKERFLPEVSFKDENGKEDWLFESFLAIEFCDYRKDNSYKGSYMLGQGGGGVPSANKASWTYLMDYWFKRDNGFDALDKAIEEVKGRLGEPKSKRYVLMTLPDAIIHSIWDQLSSKTVYWGELNGKSLDFDKKEDRVAALKWYIDEVRARFEAQNYKNIELLGFYVISEDLAITVNGTRYGWSTEYKRNEEIYPEISRYIHSLNEGLYWIPYNHSGGHQLWKSYFEMDMAYMQPNYFWVPKEGQSEKDLPRFYETLAKYGLGMELEFDDALLGQSESAKIHKNRFRTYLEGAKFNKVWGTKPFAVYQGNDTFYKLSISQDETDKEIFMEICHFIHDNPIKKY